MAKATEMGPNHNSSNVLDVEPTTEPLNIILKMRSVDQFLEHGSLLYRI